MDIDPEHSERGPQPHDEVMMDMDDASVPIPGTLPTLPIANASGTADEVEMDAADEEAYDASGADEPMMDEDYPLDGDEDVVGEAVAVEEDQDADADDMVPEPTPSRSPEADESQLDAVAVFAPPAALDGAAGVTADQARPGGAPAVHGDQSEGVQVEVGAMGTKDVVSAPHSVPLPASGGEGEGDVEDTGTEEDGAVALPSEETGEIADTEGQGDDEIYEEEDEDEQVADEEEHQQEVGAIEGDGHAPERDAGPDVSAPVNGDEEEYYEDDIEAQPDPAAAPTEEAGVPEALEDSDIDEMLTVHTLPPILIHPPSGPAKLLFTVPGDEEAYADIIDAELDVWLEGQAETYGNASLDVLLGALRTLLDVQLKELVLEERGLGLVLGEHDKHLASVTLLELLQVYHSCELPLPVQLHARVDESRFVDRFEAIRRELVVQAEMRKSAPALEEDEGYESEVDEEAEDGVNAEDEGDGGEQEVASHIGEDVRAQYGGSQRGADKDGEAHPHAEWARTLPTEPMAYGAKRVTAPAPLRADDDADGEGEGEDAETAPRDKGAVGDDAPEVEDRDTQPSQTSEQSRDTSNQSAPHFPLDAVALKRKAEGRPDESDQINDADSGKANEKAETATDLEPAPAASATAVDMNDVPLDTAEQNAQEREDDARLRVLGDRVATSNIYTLPIETAVERGPPLDDYEIHKLDQTRPPADTPGMSTQTIPLVSTPVETSVLDTPADSVVDLGTGAGPTTIGEEDLADNEDDEGYYAEEDEEESKVPVVHAVPLSPDARDDLEEPIDMAVKDGLIDGEVRDKVAGPGDDVVDEGYYDEEEEEEEQQADLNPYARDNDDDDVEYDDAERVAADDDDDGFVDEGYGEGTPVVSATGTGTGSALGSKRFAEEIEKDEDEGDAMSKRTRT